MGSHKQRGHVDIKNLSIEEATIAGHDTAELDEIPIIRMSNKFSYIDFEEDLHNIWILQIETKKQERKKGHATAIINELKNYAQKRNKTVTVGTYTTDGEKYLKHIAEKIFSS